LIKFLNDLPIYAPEVERKIFDHVKLQSLKKQINPAMTSSFFQAVIEHSKDLQIRLAILMKGREQEANKMLAEAISSLKKDRASQKTNFPPHMSGDEKTSSDQQLLYWRPFIEEATDNILSEMASISNRNRLYQELAAKNCGSSSTSALIHFPASVHCRQSRL
jgi:hypothetical protein